MKSFYSFSFILLLFEAISVDCRYGQVHPKGADAVNLIQLLIGRIAGNYVIEIEEETYNWKA